MTRILLALLVAAAVAMPATDRPVLPRTSDTAVVARDAEAPVTADKDGDDDDDDDDSSGRGGGDRDPVTVTGVIPAGSLVIDILDDDGYTPPSLEIDLGQQVTWVNQHHDEHTATGVAFDTDVIAPGGTATVTFDSPGRFAFACQFHAEMTGTIAVRGIDGLVPEASPAAPQPSTGASAPPAQAIDIVERAFVPPSLSVPIGTTVVWTDVSESPHTVTAGDGSFGSDILLPGTSFAHTFDTAGNFAYVCTIHDEMQGVIVVEALPGGSAAPASPAASGPPAA
jgi:plastocyanin